MVYIAKFPVFTQEKKNAAKKYNEGTRFKSRYGYLEVGKSTRGRGHRLDLHLLIRDKHETIRIDIAKHYLYDVLLFHNMFRPIPRQSKDEDKLWLHPNARALKAEKEFNQMLPDEMRARIEYILRDLHGIIKESPEKQQIIAKRHFDKLVMSQWKADLLHTMWKAENFTQREIDILGI